jgi:hypothetical protein
LLARLFATVGEAEPVALTRPSSSRCSSKALQALFHVRSSTEELVVELRHRWGRSLAAGVWRTVPT